MENEPSSPTFPRYCILCGASLTYSEMTITDGQEKTSYRCSGCGNEGAYSPKPEKSGIAPGRPAKELHERQWQYVEFTRQIRAEGVSAIVRAAHFPLFALNDLRERFPLHSYNWGGKFRSDKTPQVAVSRFRLTYAGPGHPNITERIVIEQEDNDFRPVSHLTADKAQNFDTNHFLQILRRLPMPNEPTMHALWEGKAIYQYVNLELARRATVISASIQLRSGEFASWAIRRFDAPLPIAYAHTKIENTILDVGGIGPAANEIESLLRQLTRLTPESAALDQLNRSNEPWIEYLRRLRERLDKTI